MKLNLSSKKLKKLLYFACAFIAFGWLVYLTITYWNKNYETTAAANNAVLVQINNGLQNLSKPNLIAPGQTSGNADPLIANYLSSQKQITEQYLEAPNLFMHGYETFKISSLNKQSYAEFNKISAKLYELTNILSATQKFLEYNPKIDLAPIVNGEESGNQERLNRTKTGIQDIINAVKASGYSKSGQIETILAPLPAQAESITANNAEDWYNQVDEVQKAVIALVYEDFTSSVNESSKQLTDIAILYLE